MSTTSITTGDGLVVLRDVVEGNGGKVAAVACFAPRTAVDASERLAAPVYVSVALDLPAFPAEWCELGHRGVHVEDALDIS